MIIDDTSAVETKKVTLENLLSVINVLTAETTVDGAADYVAVWDTSASAIRKVLPNNLPVPTGALNADGSVPLTANWDAGSFEIRAQTFQSDVATGTAPIIVASTTVVSNLNADQVDGCDVIDEDNMSSDSATAVPTQQSVKAYVDASVVGLYDHKGAYNASTNSPDLDTSPSGILKGDAYTVSVAGAFFAVSVDAGDVLIADQDSPTLSSHWTIVNRNIDESAFATASHNHAASDITSGTLAHERGGIEADISGVAIGDILAGTGAGTMALVTSTGHSDGDVLTLQADGTVDFEAPSGGGVTDHGALTGLSDDDHPQYAKLAGETFTGVHDFGGATSVEIPNGAAPTVDAAGEIAVDTTITDYTGLVTYHDGTEALYVVALPTANLSTTDHEVVAYDAVNNEFHMIGAVAPYVEDTLNATAAGDIVYQTGTDGEWTNLPIGATNDRQEVRGGLPSWQPRMDAALARCVATSNVDMADGSWDVSTGSYASKSLSVSTQSTTPHGVAFSSDGTKAYVLENGGDTIYQYTLSTAWDISTGSYASKSLSVTSQETAARGLAFSSDGTKAYIVGSANDTIYQYTLSTAWDVSTGSYASKSLSVSTQSTTPSGLAFSADGTKAYVLEPVTSDTIYQYTLSTAWDISTGSYASKSLSVASQEGNPNAVAFSSDGTKAYIVGSTNDTIYQYTLSTAWDISTGSYASKSLSVTSQETEPLGLAFSSDGTKAYVVGSTNDTIYQYTLSSTPADPSPIDGQTLANDDRVLLSGQTDASENGVYDAVTATDPSTWTRVADMAATGGASGRMVAVRVGTTYATSLWVCEAASGADVVGTDDLTFTQYA
jgi:sugar lactone lactonase YvrE